MGFLDDLKKQRPRKGRPGVMSQHRKAEAELLAALALIETGEIDLSASQVIDFWLGKHPEIKMKLGSARAWLKDAHTELYNRVVGR